MKPLSPEARDRLDELLRSCIHCGLCLSDCPTYLATGNEAESPRGRLMILSELEQLGVAHPEHAGEHPLSHTQPLREPLDRCLGCRHCETVCPSGVRYASLLDRGRERLGPTPGVRGRWATWIVDQILSRPRRLAPLARLGQGMRDRGLHRLLPPPFDGFLESLPQRRVVTEPQAPLPRHGEVAILAGCAQSVFEPEVIQATARLIEAAGFTPYLPPDQGCCGAMSHHAGSHEHARALGRELIDSLEGCTTLVIPSAGCSSHLREYGELFASDPEYAERAGRLACASIDLVAWLDLHSDRLEFAPDPRRVVYHPPCHHRHAQGLVEEAPRLLRRVPELELLPLRDAERCCGSAGSYSLLQPELARAIRKEKLERILETSPELVLTANPGCEFFLESGLAKGPGTPPVQHLAVYLSNQLLVEGAGSTPTMV